MIHQNLDTVKSRLRDVIHRKERDLPPADDELEVLERALQWIESLQHDVRMGVPR